MGPQTRRAVGKREEGFGDCLAPAAGVVLGCFGFGVWEGRGVRVSPYFCCLYFASTSKSTTGGRRLLFDGGSGGEVIVLGVNAAGGWVGGFGRGHLLFEAWCCGGNGERPLRAALT